MSSPGQPDPADVLGRRVAAGLIDVLVLVALFVALALLIGESEADDGSFRLSLSGGPALLYFALSLLYYLVPEATSGRSLGKALLGLRVVREDGGKATAGPVLARTVLRIIDGLPLLYLVGFVSVLVTGQRRARLGDLAAGTRVVRG